MTRSRDPNARRHYHAGVRQPSNLLSARSSPDRALLSSVMVTILVPCALKFEPNSGPVFHRRLLIGDRWRKASHNDTFASITVATMVSSL